MGEWRYTGQLAVYIGRIDKNKGELSMTKEISVIPTSQMSKGSIRKTVNNLGPWKIEGKESWSCMFSDTFCYFNVSEGCNYSTVCFLEMSHLPMNAVTFGLMIPLGRRWKSYSTASTTTVCPALLPPWAGGRRRKKVLTVFDTKDKWTDNIETK